MYQRCGAPQGWDLPRLGVLPVWAIAARVAAALGADDDVRYSCGRLEPSPDGTSLVAVEPRPAWGRSS